MFSPSEVLAEAEWSSDADTTRAGGNVSVRPYPFPFIAALAVSNDVDSMNRAAFEDWHAFVNGIEATSYGPGLGLEVGDSFWVWAGTRSDVLSIHREYPFEQGRIDSPDTPRIAELGHAGWLDTLHSFGNWRSPPDDLAAPLGDRAEAEYALEKLASLGLKPRVFVNHGGSPSNIGGLWGTYQKADDPDHPMYCADLLRAFGFQYFWIDQCVHMEKFGDHLAYSSDRELRAAIATYPWSAWLRRTGKLLDDDPPIFPHGQAELRRLLQAMFNETIVPISAKDGAPILAFKRYRSPYQPTASTFPIQVTAAKLDALERRRGEVIVYQHFGVQSLRGRGKSKAPGATRRAVPPVLDEHAVACWRGIAERWRAGRLFVATTARLLDWLWLRDHLRFRVERGADLWVIRLEGARCPALGGRPLDGRLLNGLGFLVPPDAPMTILVGEEGRAIATSRAPDPGHPSRHAVFTKWTSLEWIPQENASV